MNRKQPSLTDLIWDTWCCVSLIGIWPRYIEPNIIRITHLNLPVANLPSALEGLRIVQLSDLHLHSQISRTFLDKIKSKVKALQPDILAFTGDFLCYGQLDAPEPMRNLLKNLPAKYGNFAVLGNHDYSQPVSVSSRGDYDVIDPTGSSVKKGFRYLFQERKATGWMNPRVHEVGFHSEFIDLLKETPFELLHNENRWISIKGAGLNICGLGEYMLGRCLPEHSFSGYRIEHPGVVLLHNPDGFKKLHGLPGEIVLCGHTHGGQINLPWMWKRFVVLENLAIRRGLYRLDGKWVYVNRGIGSVMKFRWFASPEILSITLRKGEP